MNSKDLNAWADKLPDVKRLKRHCRNNLLVLWLCLSAVSAICIWNVLSSLQDLSIKEDFFLLGVTAVFTLLALGFFIVWLKSFSYKVDLSHMGVIVDKSRFSQSDIVHSREKKSFYIIAKVGNKTMEGRCLFSTYKKCEIGDSVLIFHMGKSESFAVKIDQ